MPSISQKCHCPSFAISLSFTPSSFSFASSSYSGGTPDHPALIQYACDLMTNVRPVSPALVIVPSSEEEEKAACSRAGNGKNNKGGSELMTAILGGRPVVALIFDNMIVSAF